MPLFAMFVSASLWAGCIHPAHRYRPILAGAGSLLMACLRRLEGLRAADGTHPVRPRLTPEEP